MPLPSFLPNLPIGFEPDDTFWLVPGEELFELLASGKFARVDKADAARAMFGGCPDRAEVEQFLFRLARHSSPSLLGHDPDPDVLQYLLERGEVVAVREADESALDPSQHLLLEQRKTARELAPILITFPLPGGRRCMLVTGIDLDRVAGRDSYHVVPRAEAETMLNTLTGNLRIHASSRSVIAKAIELLSPDWRPPRPPQGLVLLREASRIASTARQDEVMTPSQMRAIVEKEREVNLEVVVLGLDDKPLQDIQFTIEGPDGESHEGDLGSSGKTKVTSSKKGTASVTLAWAESEESN